MPQYEISVPGQGTFRVDSPTELTDQQAWQAVQNQLNAPQPTTGAFAAGVKSYLPQVQETFGGLKTLLGVGAERMLGEGQISRGLIESGAASMKEAEAKRQPFMTAERGSFTDALDKGVGAVLTEWLPYQAGSGAMQLLESLGLMGAGALAGSVLPGPGTLAGAGTGLVARELAKKGVKEAAEKILKERGEDAAKAYFENEAKKAARKIGGTAALASQAAFYGTGQTTSRAVEEAQKLGGTATDIELARVLPAAAVSTVAEFIGDKIALGALKGIKPGEAGKYAPVDLAKNILLNIGLTGTKEVPVEVIQSVAERYGAKLSLTDAQALKEYIDATAASYGMAVAPGVGGGVRQTMAERARPVTPEVQTAPPVAPPPAAPVAKMPAEPAPAPPVVEAPPVQPAAEVPAAPPVAPVTEAPPAAPPVEPAAPPVAPVAEVPVPPVAEEPAAAPAPTAPAAPPVETAAPSRDFLSRDVDDVTTLPIPKTFGGASTENRLFHGGTWQGAIADKQGVVIDGVPATSFTRNPFEALEYASQPGGKVVSASSANLKIYAGDNAELNEKYQKEGASVVKKAGYDGIDLRALYGGGYNEVVVWNTGALQDLKSAPVKNVVDGIELEKNFEPITPPAAPTVEAAAPKAEAQKPALTDYQKRLKDYWDNTATPAIRNYLSAINSFGIERLEKNFVKPAGMTPREWLESFVSKQSTWDKGRKTGETGIQALSTKNLWPTTDGSGERLRKAMLEAVKVLKNAPGSTGDLVSEAFGERAATPKAEAPSNISVPASEVEEKTTPAEEAKDIQEPTIRNKLKTIAQNLGVLVFETGEKYSSSSGVVTIPTEDKQVEGAQSPEHVFAHELGHAILQKRGVSYKGMPKAELDKWIPGWEKLKAISKSYRPEIHNHKLPKFRRHANKPDEIIADALGSFLLGISSKQDIDPIIKALNLNDYDLGLKGKTEPSAAPAAPTVEAAAPKVEAPAAPKQPAFVYRTGGGDQTKMQMFTEDATVEFNNVSGKPQLVILGKNIAGTGEDSIVVYHNNVDRRSNAYDAKDLQKVLDVDPTMVKAIQKWLASDASTITSNGQELAKTLSDFVEGGAAETPAATKAEAPALTAPAQAEPTKDRRQVAAETVRKATVQRTNVNSAMVWQIIGPDGEALSGPPGVYPGREGPLAGSATMGNRGWKTKREANAALAYLNQKADEVLGSAPSAPEAKSLGGERAQVQAFEQTLRSLLNKFGLKDVGLKILDGMTDSGSYAAQIIRIAADAANPVRTLRHEAIHALRELGFFTDAQWSSLSKMAKDKWIDQYLKQRNVDGKPLKAGEESRYDAYIREYNGDMEKITEEAVSDAFADFDATKPPAGMLQALLKRMKDLFQSIKSALTKVESPEQIFGKVEKGELKEGAREAKGEAKSLRDRATANFRRWFGDSKVVDEKGEPLVVYHGTNKDIATFKPGRGGGAIWFASTPELANLFVSGGRRNMGEGAKKGSAVYPVYLSIKRPLDLGSTSPQDNLSVADVLRMAKLPSDEQALRNIAQANLTSGYAFVTPSNSDPAGYLVSQYERNTSRAAYTLDDPGLMAVLQAAGFDGLRMKEEGTTTYAAFNPTQIKSATGNNGEYSLTNADIRKSIGGRNPGEQAISIVNSLGMGVKPPEPGRAEKAMKMLKDAGENPSLTKESAKKTLTQWLDWFETTVFSSDSAFNNKIRRGIISDFKQNPEVLGMLLEASQSQTVHADALANQFMIDGGLQYNDDLKKWESVKKPDNFVALAKKIEELATKYNVTKDEMERIAHTYFVAKRLPGIIKRNEELDAEIKAERATAKPDRKQIEEWESLKVFVSDEQLAMMEPGLSLVKTIPELKEVVDIWQGIRKNNIDVMVNSGLWSPEYATAMWDNMDYVPYYREEQLEEGAGPQEFIRGLQVKSKEFQLKGSGAAVNDVFDNMIRWSQYAMNRAIRAHKATQMIDAALKIEVDGKPMATKVTEQKRGMNIVRAFRDGKQELYDMADPLFVPAFSSIQNVSIPTLTFMSKVSNVLRQSVVLYPLFSVAQVPQDSFAAMFSSGLKTQHALKIPYLAVKEFIKTLSKTSATHNELTKYGVVGVRDFSATIIRNDAEIYAGLKPPKGGWGKTKEFLEHIAMAADNAVRQAVYEASMQQGLNKSEALEKAFEIINFRRRGTSKMLNVMGQTVPFFYAYLSAQRVAYRVLSGVGISPSDRKEALTTLATTSAAVAALSMIYAMANGDDEDYAETPAAIRDRTLTIPGSGGVRIPLRPDFFLLPKIVAEHTYLMLSDKGFEDGAKFRKSIADALLSAVASPTPFPTAIKPAIEVAINYDFFQGKPLIGNFEKQKDIERQFRDSTSELAKILSNVPLSYSLEKGKFEGLSPIAIDHMIRGMLGSFGGLLLFGTNQFLHSDPDVPRPELSAKEMLAALPGTSGLLKRPQESALKNDFYQLRDEVEKAVNTFNDIKTRSPEGIEAFLEDEKNMARLMLGKPVDKINRELSKIRKVMTQITNMPESQMSADEKSENIRQLRDLEREILRSVNVKELREMAKI